MIAEAGSGAAERATICAEAVVLDPPHDERIGAATRPVVLLVQCAHARRAHRGDAQMPFKRRAASSLSGRKSSITAKQVSSRDRATASMTPGVHHHHKAGEALATGACGTASHCAPCTLR
eukprot:NODE_17236_length_954_cov_3.927449.p2 GENE.NODE_17236_length_954_cov_3.927449~~NODE_17236_length_954_cov_3.927449.p2  ORF type:complete len:120 (+),score=22.85 NODE_17236_length_954_cov_3.927449:592-951(+)